MLESATVWLEHGLRQASGPRAEARPGAAGARRLMALLPPITGIARLWGSLEPQRVAGAAAGLGLGPLRAAARAAAMEFADWPVPLATGVLRRAESDLLDQRWRQELSPTLLLDLADGLALAWARQAPDELPAVHDRLHQQLGAGAGAGLWSEVIRARAAARERFPTPGDLPPGTMTDWRWHATRALTAAQRARACLAVAAALEETSHR